MAHKTETAVYLLSLGCDKNKVDGEVMLGRLLAAGYTAADDPAEAEIIIVNTCGFIREAVQESIDFILEMAAYKEAGSCKALVVAGCMTERYRSEMAGEMPEADAVLGVADREKIVSVLAGLHGGIGFPEDCGIPPAELQYRLLARRGADFSHYAYVKIAEGCDNRCAYCTIPAIRGGYKSRPMEEILEECRGLIADGVRELVLVAQDTARYGTDLYGEARLPDLLRGIDALCGDGLWVRLLYVYPRHITPALIHAVAELPSVCKYLDMPLQHCEESVLTRMGRLGSRESLGDLITRLREQVPGIILRTTLMVGFPGETEAEFQALYDFAAETRFDRLGVFPYSQEAGTPAADMPGQLDEAIKEQRRESLMVLQQGIHEKKQRDLIGKKIDVIIDDAITEGEPPDCVYTYTGRTQGDAPEVDAVVRFSASVQFLPGQVVPVCLTDADEYDLEGVYAHESSE